jgi:hypothetical protein
MFQMSQAFLQIGEDEGGCRGDQSRGEDPGEQGRKTGLSPPLRKRPFPVGFSSEQDETGNPEEQADAEVDGGEVPRKAGLQADEIEARCDAEAETAAGEEAQRQAGCAVLHGRTENEGQQDAEDQWKEKGGDQQKGQGLRSFR